MASFSIYDYGPDWIGVDVPMYGSYSWYRVYVRDDYGNVYHDEWYYHTSTVVSLQVEVSGLEPETEYVVNVAHASSENGSDSTWGTAQYVTTTSSTGGGGSTDTVDVHIDFDTSMIYRVRLLYNDGTDDVRVYFYEPGWISVAEESYIEVLRLDLTDEYADMWPAYCEDTNSGLVYTIKDENGDWTGDEFLLVEYWDVTFRFYIDTSGGGDVDYGSFVERTVYINGLEYAPHIYSPDSNGVYDWYEYKTLIAE